MSKAFIGAREVVWNGTLIVPDAEVGRIEATLANWPISIELKFRPNDAEKPELSWTGSGNKVEMTFKGWKTPLGSAIKVPQRLGETNDGKTFGFLAAVYRVGDVSKIDFLLLLGGNYG